MAKKKSNNVVSLKLIGILLFLTLLVGIFLGFGLVNFSYVGAHEVQQTEFTPVSYTDYVTILLTAITVLLAILGTFFAIIAIVGYQVIKQSAINEASKTVLTAFDADGEALKTLMKKLESDTGFQDKVAETLGRIYYANEVADDDILTDEENGDVNDL